MGMWHLVRALVDLHGDWRLPGSPMADASAVSKEMARER